MNENHTMSVSCASCMEIWEALGPSSEIARFGEIAGGHITINGESKIIAICFVRALAHLDRGELTPGDVETLLAHRAYAFLP